MKDNRSIYIQNELLWLLITGILTAIAWIPIYYHTELIVKGYLLLFIIVSVYYFRFIIYLRQIPLFNSFAAKLILFFLNFPLYFLVLGGYNWLTNALELYIYKGFDDSNTLLKEGMSYAAYNFLHSITLFFGIAAFILIVLLQLRLMFTVFKHKEIPGATVTE